MSDGSPNREICISDMTWEEVRDAQLAGFSTMLFACGATEQHGPHLPLSVDALVGGALALRVAQKMGGTLVAPPIAVGCSDHHMDFSGTLSLREETFKAVVSDYCHSAVHHGFANVCVLPSHGGNFRPVKEVVEVLQGGLSGDVHVFAYGDLSDFVNSWRQIIADFGGASEHVGGHADIAEASIVLALSPNLVREGRAEAGYMGELEAALPRIWRDGFASITPNGVLGDPAGMSAAIGEALLDGLSTRIADHFTRAMNELA